MTSFAPTTTTGMGFKLAMQRLWVSGTVMPAGARLMVRHVFRSDEKESVEVIYPFPLPRDATMRRFRIETEDAQMESELRSREEALREYERGIQSGSLSALAHLYGDGLVNLNVGNIRPGETVAVSVEMLAGMELRDDGFRFRFPFALAPRYHSQARCVTTAHGEGEIELPANEFGDLILPRFRASASGLHECGFDLSIASALDIEELGSPSHAVRVRRDAGATSRISLAPEKDVPNRDLVIDARYSAVQTQVLAGKGQFAAVIPSVSFGSTPDTPRRVVFLIDRSGSMEGPPMHQALRSVEACLGALSPDDQFGAIAFDDRVEVFRPAVAAGSRENRDALRDYLRGVGARGGTELAQGVAAAAGVLGAAGGDVFVITDGQVMGTEAIIAKAKAANVRLHCLGIGSASQDRFLATLARETAGVSRFVGANERVDLAAVDLFASAGRPVASGLKCGPSISPEPPPVRLRRHARPALRCRRRKRGRDVGRRISFPAGTDRGRSDRRDRPPPARRQVDRRLGSAIPGVRGVRERGQA